MQKNDRNMTSSERRKSEKWETDLWSLDRSNQNERPNRAFQLYRKTKIIERIFRKIFFLHFFHVQKKRKGQRWCCNRKLHEIESERNLSLSIILILNRKNYDEISREFLVFYLSPSFPWEKWHKLLTSRVQKRTWIERKFNFHNWRGKLTENFYISFQSFTVQTAAVCPSAEHHKEFCWMLRNEIKRFLNHSNFGRMVKPRNEQKSSESFSFFLFLSISE